jgi:hypothetical protein
MTNQEIANTAARYVYLTVLRKQIDETPLFYLNTSTLDYEISDLGAKLQAEGIDIYQLT